MSEVSSTDLVLRCIATLAEARAKFRDVHIAMQKDRQFCEVSTDVFPGKTQACEYADYGVTLSVALNCELCKPISEDKKALGMSVLVRHSNGVWVCEFELGWSGLAVGWDAFDSTTVESATIEMLLEDIPSGTNQLCEKFLEFVKKL